MTCATSSFQQQQQQDQTRQTHLSDGDDDRDDDDDEHLHKEVGDYNLALFKKKKKTHLRKLLIEISLINCVFVFSRLYCLT